MTCGSLAHCMPHSTSLRSSFVELVKLIYRAEDDEPRDLDQHTGQLASHAWAVLHDSRRVPGHRDGTQVEEAHLRQWIRQARLWLVDVAALTLATSSSGNCLQVALSTQTGFGRWCPSPSWSKTWAAHLEKGVYVGLLNARGVTTRGVFDGGDQERALASQYIGWAKATESWPRTSRVLSDLAEDYEREARREDERAARDADDG